MEKINIIKNQIKNFFAGDSSGHDYWHSLRVYNNAIRLAEDTECDKEIVSLAALLHDVDDAKIYHTENYENARRMMKEAGYGNDTVEMVVKIIGEISFRGEESIVPESIEGKIVQDADRLDAMGAIGIARTFAYGGYKNKELYNPEILPKTLIDSGSYLENDGSSINHFYEKLFKIKDMMNTEKAKEIAEERDLFMHKFLDEFMDEWEGI
ncbi:MAG: HD domain-containing protein [Lachnospiraceae bacterium]|nr:HD domain-containing protein [Lachnospiraceae bacterium]